jgi:hypothetical protein
VGERILNSVSSSEAESNGSINLLGLNNLRTPEVKDELLLRFPARFHFTESTGTSGRFEQRRWSGIKTGGG